MSSGLTVISKFTWHEFVCMNLCGEVVEFHFNTLIRRFTIHRNNNVYQETFFYVDSFRKNLWRNAKDSKPIEGEDWQEASIIPVKIPYHHHTVQKMSDGTYQVYTTKTVECPTLYLRGIPS